VKEQLKKIGGMEFYDVHFSYIDQETMEEKFISVPEQGGGKLIPDGPLNPGVLHTVATGSSGHLGSTAWRPRSPPATASSSVGPGIEQRGQGVGQGRLRLLQGQRQPGQRLDQGRATTTTTCTSSNCTTPGPTTGHDPAHLRRLVLGLSGKPVQGQMVVLGSMSLGGSIIPVENLAESLQVAFDAGAKRILLPMASVTDIPTSPASCSPSSRPASTPTRWMRCSRRWEQNRVSFSEVFASGRAGDSLCDMWVQECNYCRLYEMARSNERLSRYLPGNSRRQARKEPAWIYLRTLLTQC
jgi:hypothetical protein